MSIENVIEKVKKLLALSQSANVHEAENAVRLANNLIDQYRLSEADITGESTSDPLVEDDSYVYETGKKIMWKVGLVDTLSQHYGCSYFNNCYRPFGQNGKRRLVTRYKLLGRKSDIQIVQYMFAYLTAECSRLSDIHAKGSGHVAVFSFCNGFVAGIREQLLLSRKETEKTATSDAIVKINMRGQEADDFKKRKHPDLVYKNLKSYSRDHDAYSAGKIKGKAVHLGQTIGGKTVKLLGPK